MEFKSFLNKVVTEKVELDDQQSLKERAAAAPALIDSLLKTFKSSVKITDYQEARIRNTFALNTKALLASLQLLEYGVRERPIVMRIATCYQNLMLAALEKIIDVDDLMKGLLGIDFMFSQLINSLEQQVKLFEAREKMVLFLIESDKKSELELSLMSNMWDGAEAAPLSVKIIRDILYLYRREMISLDTTYGAIKFISGYVTSKHEDVLKERESKLNEINNRTVEMLNKLHEVDAAVLKTA